MARERRVLRTTFRMAYVRLRITVGHMPERIEKFTKIDPLMMPTSNFPPQHFSDDMRDLRLSFWGTVAPRIGFRGLEA